MPRSAEAGTRILASFPGFTVLRQSASRSHQCSRRFSAPIPRHATKNATDYIKAMDYVKRKGNQSSDPIHIDVPIAGEYRPMYLSTTTLPLRNRSIQRGS